MGLGNLVEKLKLVSFINSNTRRNVEIPVGDSLILRANINLPSGKPQWPVILMAYPYMKDGIMSPLFSLEAFQMTSAGYAVVLVDLPGIGASDGLAKNPFDILNPDILAKVVEWCAAQDFSDGNVGMLGESFGGMAALNAATANPPALKAIFSMMAPINFYPNLVFPGGSLNMLGLFGSWINIMNLIQILPPMNHTNLKNWKEIWQKHLDDFEPFITEPVDHTLSDSYWKNVNIDSDKITVPTYILDGWNGFSHKDSTELFHQIRGPKKLVIGPWVHMWPSLTDAQPTDYLTIALRWFDYWLKGIPNGIMEAPPVSVYFMGEEHWRYEENWPPNGVNEIVMNLRSNRSLGKGTEVRDMMLICAHDPTVGAYSGLMSVLTLGIDYPKEQSKDDARSISFTTSPIPENIEITGEPRVTLTVSTDMPDAAITVRLCDVDAEENSKFITRGWMRLSRRNGLDKVSPVEPGKTYKITIPLLPTAYRLEKLHSVRVSIQLSDFPRLFSLPYAGNISLHFGPDVTEELVLPSLKDKPLPTFKPQFTPADTGMLNGVGSPKQEKIWEIRDNPKEKNINVLSGLKLALNMFPGLPDINLSHTYEANAFTDNPAKSVLTADAEMKFHLDGKQYHAHSEQTTTHDNVSIKCTITENEKVIFEKKFEKKMKWFE